MTSSTAQGRAARGAKGLRSELRAAYAAATGNDTPRHRQLDAMEAMIRYLSRLQAREGDRILRSVPKMSKGLGLPVEGLTVRQVRDLYENRITNTLRYLELAGFVDHVERDLRHDNGEGIGIVVVLPAGVAQSVRASRKAPRTRARGSECPPPRPSFCGELAPPLGGLQGGGDLRGCPNYETSNAAGARKRASSTRDRAAASTQARTALQLLNGLTGSDESGVAWLELRPGLAEIPVDVIAREAWRLFAGNGTDPRLSLLWLGRLEKAAVQIERCGYGPLRGPAASRAAVIDLARGEWRPMWEGRGYQRRPWTLGGLAVCLRRLAHEAVEHYRSGRQVKRRARRAPEAQDA